MKKEVVPVQIRGLLPANSGVALFIGNDEKVFVIQVEHNMGAVIGMALRGTPKDRPLTHDLIGHIFHGFGIAVERVVITELKNSTYYARLILKQENELGSKLVELDARPSDCLAIAAAQKKPVFVSRGLFEEVEDMTEVLERINQDNSATTAEGSEPAESEEEPGEEGEEGGEGEEPGEKEK
jgi:bifunctional DNase/RNase